MCLIGNTQIILATDLNLDCLQALAKSGRSACHTVKFICLPAITLYMCAIRYIQERICCTGRLFYRTEFVHIIIYNTISII